MNLPDLSLSDWDALLDECIFEARATLRAAPKPTDAEGAGFLASQWIDLAHVVQDRQRDELDFEGWRDEHPEES